MTDLNPCPNCGREPDVMYHDGITSVHCVWCIDGFTITSASSSGAMNAWNAATGGEQAAPTEKTLRDEFAMAYITGVAAVATEITGYPDDLAREAYGVADSMLKEREK